MKVEVTPANEHDSRSILPLLDQLASEHPEVHVGNANADNGYASDDNSAGLVERKIADSTAPREGDDRKIPKKRQNQRKCIEGDFGIFAQCLGLEWTWVRGLPAVKKDTSLKFIAFLVQVCVAYEAGREDKSMKPTYFFG